MAENNNMYIGALCFFLRWELHGYELELEKIYEVACRRADLIYTRWTMDWRPTQTMHNFQQL